MKETIINHTTAELLMNKGFKTPTKRGYYKHGTDKDFVKLLLNTSSEDGEPEFGYAPTQTQICKLLRDYFGFHIVVNCARPHKAKKCAFYSSIVKFNVNHKNKFRSEFYKTFEEAMEIGIQECIKMVSFTES